MKMKVLRRALSIAMLCVLSASAAFAGGQTATSTKPLDPKEDPTLVGKRDINKHQIDFYSLEKEAALGAGLAAQVAQQAKFIDDPIITEYVNRVGQNIVLHSDAKVPFTIKVVDSDDVNAFALPGGFFFVNKGLLLAADNEAELAGVMSHEIAHVAARHGVENASKGTLLNYATIPLIFLGGGIGYAARTAAGILVPISFLKFSRNAEYEADMLGAQYMWASGYDPQALSDFFKKLEGKEKKKPGTFSRLFSTHPMSSDRLERVNALVARFPPRDEYIVTTSEFDRVKAHLVALTNAPDHMGGPGGSSAPQKPTLKRRQPTDPGSTPDVMDPSNDPTAPQGDPNATPAPSDRPTLKRSDSDTPPPPAPPTP
ncbi:MAG TPA: M48 family metallopeptidase [Blastocatellia bacterium]|nr:M48 family metallopeptidase [Blastocatellia bacterium]